MKWFAVFFILSIFFVASTNDAYALLVSEDPVGEMDVVVVGTIVSAVPGTNSYGVPETKYVADIEEVIKGSSLLEAGANTKSLEFYAPGVLDEQDNPIYRKIFDINDRALLMLEQKDGFLQESLWSRTTQSNCKGNELIQLFDAPGGLSIHQDETNNPSSSSSSFYTNHPIVAQYSFFNKNLTATTLNVTINVIDDFPDIYHSESFVLSLEECQAYATAKTEFTLNDPGSISIHTVVDGESSHGIGGLDVTEYVMSPLKQHQEGIPFDEIKCKEGLELVGKMPHVHPKCVKSESVEKLTIRGWATSNKTLELVNPQKFAIEKDDQLFEVWYSLKGAALKDILHDSDANSIHIALSDSVGGQMVISIPRDLMDVQIGMRS